MEKAKHKSLTKKEKIICTAGLLLLVSVYLATASRYGMCWDEGYYYPAYVDVWTWVKQLFSSPSNALSADGIEAGWSQIHELPPVTKWVGAFCVAITPAGHELGFLRLGSFLLYILTLVMLFLVTRRLVSTKAGVMGALVYGANPQVMAHGHFAASETPMAFVVSLLLAGAVLPRRNWVRVVALGVGCGMALATKVNGIIALAAVLTWIVLRATPFMKQYDEEERPSISNVLRDAALVAISSLVIALLIWPWMWRDTGTRISEYFHFIGEHSHQGVWFLGQRWNFPEGAERAPFYYPLVMMALTSPVLWVIAAFGTMVWGVTLLAKDRSMPAGHWLLLLLGTAPLVAAMLPNAPKYDGARLFFPAYLPLTIMVVVMLSLETSPAPIKKVITKWRPAGPVALGLMLAMGIFGSPKGLLYYNVPARLVGSTAESFPFEVSYWQEAVTPGVFKEIEEHHSGSGPIKIKTLALHPEVFAIQQQWKGISPRFEFDGEPPYDYHLLLNRKGFWSNTEWWFALNREPIMTWEAGGAEPALYLFSGLPPGTTD